MFFITGIVIEPEPTVLATEEPEYIPSSAEEITATFAGPPACEPTKEFARSTKKVPMPVFSRKEPNIINITPLLYFTLNCSVEHPILGLVIGPLPSQV